MTIPFWVSQLDDRGYDKYTWRFVSEPPVENVVEDPAPMTTLEPELEDMTTSVPHLPEYCNSLM